jgi:hypothetical protein
MLPARKPSNSQTFLCGQSCSAVDLYSGGTLLWAILVHMSRNFCQFLKANTGIISSSGYNSFQVQVQVILRPTVSRPVSLGVGPPFWADDEILNVFE